MEKLQPISSGFGELLKTYRKRRRLTQQQLAQRLGMHVNTVSSWELGSYLPASRGLILELARLLTLNEREARLLLEASLIALSPYWYVPFPRNLFFTGRREMLEELHRRLYAEQMADATQVYALYGLGGVGKTQLALEYAYQHALEYSAVLWVGAETLENIVSSLLRIAEVLELPERGDKDQQHVIEAVQRWLSTHSRWLLILDNVEDLGLLSGFLPSARQGAILLTTRSPALGTLAVGIELIPMEQKESMRFVLRRAKMLGLEATGEQIQQLAVRLPAEYAAVEELVKIMGGLPLAIDQAGAYIDETGCSLADYLQRYQQQRVALLDRRGLLGENHPHSVIATFRLASERVERKQKAAGDLLEVCALLHAEAIPEELFFEGATYLGSELAHLAADPSRFDQAMAILRSYSLIQRHLETRTFSIHRLVQVVIQEQIGEQKRIDWLRCLIVALNVIFPEVTYETWEQCERLLPHVLACAAAIPDDREHQALAEVLQKAANYLYERAQYKQAEQLYRRAIAILERSQGPDYPALALALSRLALLCGVQQDYRQAESLYQQALSIQERVLEPLHSETADSLHGLAAVYRGLGMYERAESLFQRVLHIREQTMGPNHYEVIRTLRGLATLYVEWGKYERAEPLFQRILVLTEQALGPEHPDLLYSLNGLAVLASMQGRFEQAEPFYQRAISLSEKALGPDHPNVAYVLVNQAECYTERGKYEQAESLYQRARAIWVGALGPENPRIAYILVHQAELSIRQEKYEQVASLYQQAWRIRRQASGEEHTETLQVLYDLATFYQKQGRLQEALSLAERILSTCSPSQKDAHPQVTAARALYTELVRTRAYPEVDEAAHVHEEEIPDNSEKEDPLRRASPATRETAGTTPSEHAHFQEFLRACCELHPRASSRSGDLWNAYEQWAAERHERFPLTRRAFTAQLKAHGCHADRTKTTRIWRGIRVVGADDAR